MQKAVIDRGKPNLFNEARNDIFRFRVIAGNENCATIFKRQARIAQTDQMFEINRVKAFDQPRLLQVRSHQFTGCGFVPVEFREFSITVRVIVPSVDHNLSLESVCGKVAELAKRNGDQSYIAKTSGFHNTCRLRFVAKFLNQTLEALTAPGVTQCHLMPGPHEKAGGVRPYISRTNNSYFHYSSSLLFCFSVLEHSFQNNTKNLIEYRKCYLHHICKRLGILCGLRH